MRRGERPFSATKYIRYKPEIVAKRMLALGYCQVSRAFGCVARVDVSDRELLARLRRDGSRIPGPAENWYDFYRRCVSEDVITDVPESIMFMIRNPGARYVYKPPVLSDEEAFAIIVELGLYV